MSQLSNHLKELRKLSGLSRNYIERHFNIPAVTIRSWESGSSEIRPNNLEKYLSVFAKMGFHIEGEFLNDLEEKKAIPYDGSHLSFLLSVNHMAELLHETASLFFYVDDKERVSYVNPKYQEFLLKTSSPLVLKEVFYEKTFLLIKQKISEAIEKGKSDLSYITNFQDKMVEVVIKLFPNKNYKNEVIGVWAFVDRVN